MVRIGTGENIMSGGFVIIGVTPTPMLLPGIESRWQVFGMAQVPTNDNWSDVVAKGRQ